MFDVGAPADEPWDAATSADGDGEDETPAPVFTVTNPPGTVTVAAYLDGRVHQIALSPKVVNMTERELADEIRVIADLAGSRRGQRSTRSCSKGCASTGTTMPPLATS